MALDVLPLTLVRELMLHRVVKAVAGTADNGLNEPSRNNSIV